jgi:hypothetical protein
VPLPSTFKVRLLYDPIGVKYRDVFTITASPKNKATLAVVFLFMDLVLNLNRSQVQKFVNNESAWLYLEANI